MQGFRQASVEVAGSREHLDARSHLRDQLAVLPDLLPDQTVCVGLDQLAQTPQQRCAVSCGSLWPAALVEGATRRPNRGVDVRSSRLGHAPPLFLGEGIDTRKRAPADACRPFAVDEHAEIPLTNMSIACHRAPPHRPRTRVPRRADAREAVQTPPAPARCPGYRAR